jgi:hypothetical protein
MLYINAENEYPRHIGDVQLAKPSFKEGNALPTGWVAVTESARPTPGTDEVTVEGFPETIDGVMTQSWTIRKMTADELARRDAPANARAKLIDLGLTELEVNALVAGLVR